MCVLRVQQGGLERSSDCLLFLSGDRASGERSEVAIVLNFGLVLSFEALCTSRSLSVRCLVLSGGDTTHVVKHLGEDSNLVDPASSHKIGRAHV